MNFYSIVVPDVQNEFDLGGKIAIFNDLYFLNDFFFVCFLLSIQAAKDIGLLRTAKDIGLLRTVTAVYILFNLL